jgi:xanthine/uracil permease
MSMAYSSTFALSVITGYLLTVLGAVLSLVTVIWWMGAGEWRHRQPPPSFRALTVVAVGIFIIGIFWQLVGYLRIEYSRLW